MNPNELNGGRKFRDLSTFKGHGYDKGRNVVWRFSWHVVSHLLFQPFWVPRQARPWILRFFGAKVGKRSVIRSRVRVHWPWKLHMGDDVWIGEGAWLLNLEPITIGNSVCISQEAFVCTGSHSSGSSTFEFNNSPVQIEDEVWMCARAFIHPGSKVKRGTVVPATQIFKT